jgi:DNA polymerase
LGGAAAKHILNVADGIMRIRGKWRETDVQGRKIKTIATLHPAYLLRTPAAKRLAWRDLLAIRAALKQDA